MGVGAGSGPARAPSVGGGRRAASGEGRCSGRGGPGVPSEFRRLGAGRRSCGSSDEPPPAARRGGDASNGPPRARAAESGGNARSPGPRAGRYPRGPRGSYMPGAPREGRGPRPPLPAQSFRRGSGCRRRAVLRLRGARRRRRRRGWRGPSAPRQPASRRVRETTLLARLGFALSFASEPSAGAAGEPAAGKRLRACAAPSGARFSGVRGRRVSSPAAAPRAAAQCVRSGAVRSGSGVSTPRRLGFPLGSPVPGCASPAAAGVLRRSRLRPRVAASG